MIRAERGCVTRSGTMCEAHAGFCVAEDWHKQVMGLPEHREDSNGPKDRESVRRTDAFCKAEPRLATQVLHITK